MSTLEALRDVLAVFEAAPSAADGPKPPRAGPEPELAKVVANLGPETRTELQLAAKEAAKELESALRRITERINDPVLAQPRIGELTPSDEALTAAFARGTAKAIAAAHAAGVPVHAMSAGKIVKVPPPEK